MTSAPAPAPNGDSVVAANVRARLAWRGINTQWLAKQLGLTDRTMYNKLHGITRWTANEVSAAAKVLNTNPGALYETPDGWPPAPSIRWYYGTQGEEAA